MLYFTYSLIDPFTMLPFYIGKGCKDRPHSHLRENVRNTYNRHKFNKIQKIRQNGKEPIVSIIEYYESEQEAYAAERRLISNTSGLTNIQPGGEGGKGNLEWKNNNPSSRLKNKTYNEIYGEERADQICRKRSEKLRGRLFSEETLQKMSCSASARDHSYKNRMVHTPNGVFSSAQEAAKFFSISPGSVTYRTNSSNFSDWYFL